MKSSGFEIRILYALVSAFVILSARDVRGAVSDASFIAGAQAKFPYVLELSRGSDGTFTASIAADSESTLTTIGTVNVSMTTPVPGLATTSHDPTQLATAEYDNPPD